MNQKIPLTRTIYDQFSKDCLEELLSIAGKVEIDLKVPSEVREIDVCFIPDPSQRENLNQLGTLGRIGLAPAIIEPYRNPINTNEVRKCLKKSFDIEANLQRRARRERTPAQAPPTLWILSPTISEAVLNQFNAKPDLENWLPGIYWVAEGFRTALVAIHQLPKTEETLWLRLLGRNQVQLQAIEELQQLPRENRFRDRILEIVANLIAILEVRREEQQNLEPEEGEFLMQLSTIYTQRLEEATQKGIEQGIEQGIEIGEQRGEQRGIEIAQKRLAQNLLSQGMEVEQVAELTELSPEEVRKLITSN